MALGRPLLEAGGAGGASEAPAGSAVPPSAEVTQIDPGPGLVLYSDKARYKAGDVLQLVVRVTTDCHLTRAAHW